MTDPRDAQAADAASAAAPDVTVSGPSPDVAPVGEASRLPGEHRGGFSRLPTAPVEVPLGGRDPQDPQDDAWAPTPAPPARGMAAWALACAIIGLALSFVVGWGFPIGIIGIVTGIVALRRPLESTQASIWAISLGSLSVLYSAGWLWYAAVQAGLIG